MKPTTTLHIGKLLKSYATQHKVRTAGWARKSSKALETFTHWVNETSPTTK